MTATQYFRVFVRFRLVVGVCLLAGLIVAILVTALSGTTYTSVARVQVVSNAKADNGAGEAYSTTLLAVQRVVTYADLAKGTELTTRLLADHALHLSADQLQDRIDIRLATGSTVIEIVVRDSDAARTKLIASRVTAALVDIVTEAEDAPNLPRPLLRAQVITDASTPVADTAPPAWRNLLLGAAAGVVLGLAVAVAISRLDKRLHDEGTVQQTLAAPVLGVLPGPRSTHPHDASWEAVVHEIRTGIFARHPGPGRGLTIAVTTPRPDKRVHQVVGAVAAALADTGAQVLLIDADLRDAHATPLLGSATDESPGLADYLAGTSTVEDILWQHTSSRCYVLPAGHDDPDPSDALHSAPFQALLLDAQQRYDFVLVVTTATSTGTDALAVAARCDRTLLTIALGRTTRPDLESTLRQLHLVEADVMGAVLLG